MCRYQIILTSELEQAYKEISEDLAMSMEQVLSSAVQLFMENLCMETYESVANVDSVRKYCIKGKISSEQLQKH